MRVFNFYYDGCHTACSGKDQQEATEVFNEWVGSDVEIEKVEEIHESEWDEKNITIYPYNDRTKKPFKVSIRECMESTPTLIFSNDSDLAE